MNRRIKRKALPVRVADQIEEDINEGVWLKQLPGRRELAKRYDVSAATCDGALKILDSKGLLESAQQGRARRIRQGNKKRIKKVTKHRLLILHHPLGKLSMDYYERLRGLQTAWKDFAGRPDTFDDKREVIWKEIDFALHKTPTRLLATILERYSPDAVLAFLTPEEWSTALKEAIPTFQVGGISNLKGDLSFCGYDVEDEICRAVEHLRTFGHQRILSVWNAGHFSEIARRGIRRGFGGADVELSIEDMCPIFTETTPEAWMKFWKEKLTELEPTAIILPDEVRLISFYGFCAKAKLSVPQDISVLMMNESPIFDWTHPKPTMMKFSDEKLVKLFVKWMEGDCKGIGRRMLPLEIWRGDSVLRIRKD